MSLINKVKYFLLYINKRKRIPNLFRPKDYSEIIFWDILFNRNNSKAFLADKYKVREYVKSLGLEYILPKLYGVYKDASEIDFSNLPKSFALKCNHSCGMNIICPDKEIINRAKVVDNLNKWLGSKHPVFYETHYNKIKPLIICEEYISDSRGIFPMDYKVHCANGKPIFIQCCYDRDENSPGKRLIFDTNWNDLHFVIQEDEHFTSEEIERPIHLDQMLEYASILSKGLKYVRVDFYDSIDRVIFGEMTLTPMGGWLSYFTKNAQLLMKDAIFNNK